jgi:hypothetical protein
MKTHILLISLFHIAAATFTQASEDPATQPLLRAMALAAADETASPSAINLNSSPSNRRGRSTSASRKPNTSLFAVRRTRLSLDAMLAHQKTIKNVMAAFGASADTTGSFSADPAILPAGMGDSIARGLGVIITAPAPHAGAGSAAADPVTHHTHAPRHRTASLNRNRRRTIKIHPKPEIILPAYSPDIRYNHAQTWIKELELPTTKVKERNAAQAAILYNGSNLITSVFIHDGSCYAQNHCGTGFRLTTDGFCQATSEDKRLIDTVNADHKQHSLTYLILEQINSQIKFIDAQYTEQNQSQRRFKMILTLQQPHGLPLQYILTKTDDILYALKVSESQDKSQDNAILEKSLFHILLHHWDRNPASITVTSVQGRTSCTIS